jgi:hypothetical protein
MRWTETIFDESNPLSVPNGIASDAVVSTQVQDEARIQFMISEIEELIKGIDDPSERANLRSQLSSARDMRSLRTIRAIVGTAIVRDDIEQTGRSIQAMEMDSLSIALNAETRRIIQIRANLDLSTHEGVVDLVKTYGVTDPAEAEIIANQLEAGSGDTLRVIADAPVAQRVQAFTRVAEYRQYAHDIAADENMPAAVREFGRAVEGGNLHYYDAVKELLRDIRGGEMPTADELEIALTDARSAAAVVRRQQVSRGITGGRAQDIDAQLRSVRAEIESMTNGRAHDTLRTVRGAFDNATLYGEGMPEAARRAIIRNAIAQTPTGDNMSPAQVDRLVDAQIQKPRAATRDLSQDPIYRAEMSAGYRAMINGDIEGAERRARNVGELLRSYGSSNAEVNRTVDLLINGARAGLTPAGKSYLMSLGETRAIATQEEVIRTGQTNPIMDTLMGAARTGIVPREAGAVMGLLQSGDVGGFADGVTRQLGWSSALKQQVERAIDGRTGRLSQMDANLVRVIGGSDGMSADDYLAYLERAGVITRRGMFSSDAWVEENINRLDRDDNGRLSAQELLVAGRQALLITRGMSELEARARELNASGVSFNSAQDTNNDGRISARELAKVLALRGVDSVQDIDTLAETRVALGLPAQRAPAQRS